MIFLFVCFYYFANVRCGITIPKSNCRWLTAYDWEVELRCDGNEVAVGACSGGKNKDCPGNSVHQLKCCELPNYYYSNCNTFGTSWGVNNDCRNYGNELILEGSCASGKNPDCHGNYNLAECCSGHLGGKEIGPGSASECYWDYAGYGVPLECGRSDEVIIGRCSSGKNLDCPGKSSHGNLCCELDFVNRRSPREANTTIKCPGGICDVPTVEKLQSVGKASISDLVSGANGSPMCHDMLEAFKTVGKMKVAFGCGLGPVTRGPPISCDDAIVTSIGKCHPVNSSCMILNVANNEHCLSSHGDLCGALTRVHDGLMQSLKLWCHPERTGRGSCPWYESLACAAAVAGTIIGCSIVPELEPACIYAAVKALGCSMECVCDLCHCC